VPRAMLLFERQADASWLPTTVILATPKRLRGKCLPRSPDRDARLASILTDAIPPRIDDNAEEGAATSPGKGARRPISLPNEC
jgi:hypothetical protein